MSDEQIPEVFLPAEVSVRSLSKRELDIRLALWGDTAQTLRGVEEMGRTAFDGIDPTKVLLMPPEHEVHLGANQEGKVVPVRRPQGRGTAIEINDTHAQMTFRVAQTQSGDEILALAAEGIIDGASVEMGPNKRIRSETRSGRRHQIVDWSDLQAVTTSYRQAYRESRVLAVRSQQEEPVSTEKTAPVADEPEAPETPVAKAEDTPRIEVAARSSAETDAIREMANAFSKSQEQVLDRLERIEERNRSGFTVPGVSEKADVEVGDWMSVALRMLAGDPIPAEEFRTVADFLTTDSPGLVPDAHSSELIGVIDQSRPFHTTTRQIDAPSSGVNMVVPKIVQRPTTAIQTTEKTELSSQKLQVQNVSFPMVTVGGTGDISLQMLRRSDRNYLELYLDLLAEAYALDTEDKAVAELIEAIADGGPEPASALNPNDLQLGATFQTAFNAIRRPPDTIWLSTEAVAEFIDAQATTTNQPLYPGLIPSAEAGTGIEGRISGLRAVHVPALDDKGAYAIVGPSRGFAWAQDGTFTLQAEVPTKAGRDVSLVGFEWYMPWYPAAFSLFNVAS